MLPAAAAAVVLIVKVAGPRIGLGGAGEEGAQAREFTSAIGSRTTVVLRDGTHLVLGPASRLVVPADFDDGRRVVDLDGEAIFTVVHDPARPFVVRAGGAQLQDVGTQFDVRAYSDDRAVQVAVADGQVDVVGRSQAQPLRAGDVATIADTVVAVAHGVDIAALTAWTRGELVFRDTPLRQVMADVGRWYGLEVRLADPAQGERHRMTARFSNASAAEALRSIAAVAGMTYTLSERTVTFTEAHPTH
jgi:transmembrane sensor